MQRQQKNNLRADLGVLKGQIVKRIGGERSRQYFYYLGRLLTQKLSKNEFDKMCMRLIGKEYLSLHNHFIRSILKNACDGKAPSAAERDCVKSAVDDGSKLSGYACFPRYVPWSNGVVSPKKTRSCVRDRKLKVRPGLFVPNGNVAHASHLASSTRDGNGRISTENGDFTPCDCDYQRPVNKLQEFAEPPMSEREMLVHQPWERLSMPRLIDREEALHKDCSSRNSINPPLGIPFCRSSVGGFRRPMAAADVSCYSDASLPDTASLQKRMEQIAFDHGLEGVSMKTANILNNGMDLYLKRLITSCVKMVGGRSETGLTKLVSQKQQIQSQFLNGFLPSNHLCIQNNGKPAEALQEYSHFTSILMLDFKVAMELNPQQLGEDWPLLMEKISMNQFTE